MKQAKHDGDSIYSHVDNRDIKRQRRERQKDERDRKTKEAQFQRITDPSLGPHETA